jgi:hypothetical protein
MVNAVNYGLPTQLNICGEDYDIRTDYRCVLDICTALVDAELDDKEKAMVLLDIFYPAFYDMPEEAYSEAIERCFWFINGGQEQAKIKAPKLVDWEQDFAYIIAPINKAAGFEVRSAEYMHWWTFLAYYYEIGGDCLFAQIVRIRDAKARGKKLEKHEQEWYRQNRHLVDFKQHYTSAEEELLKEWI